MAKNPAWPNWWQHFRTWATTPQGVRRGMPAPFSPADARPFRPTVPLAPFGGAIRHESEGYSRGADALTFDSGHLDLNPLGSGVFYDRQLPIHQEGRFDPNTQQYIGDFGAYVEGLGIVWGAPTPINQGDQPRGSPIYSPDILAAIMGPASFIPSDEISVQPIF